MKNCINFTQILLVAVILTTGFINRCYSQESQAALPEINFPVFMQSVSEDVGIVTVEVTTDKLDSNDINIEIIVEVSSNANNGDDFFMLNPTTVIIPANSMSGTFTVSIIDDTETESMEQIMLAISFTSSNAQTGPDSEHVIAILDNDTPTSLESLEKPSAHFSLFPNPSSTSFQIQNVTNEENTFIIINELGAEIFKKENVQSMEEFELNLVPGTYQGIIISPTNSQVSRLITY